ncbi:trypsin-like serine protease [Vibrio breoganii]|uniref:trypsin-like serine protease n=1 Tax=Vibrio breoganii TaxID=553239 RepID=UPI00031F86F0|nr:trypsin-like serine protease [Vibrio breoganii]OED94250.1 hypothetical protein A1QG_05770 [Vibrio breoganii ZF-29]
MIKLKWFKSLMALVATIAVATPCHAIINGTPVSKDAYQDHEVRFMARNEDGTSDWKSCTGMLMGGKYVLTAGHCFDTDFKIKVKILQGVDRLEPYASHERTGIAIQARRNSDAAEAWSIFQSKVFLDWVWPAQPTAFAGGVNDWHSGAWWQNQLQYEYDYLVGRSEEDKADPMQQVHNDSDLALLVLDEAVPHQSGLIVKPLVDLDSGEAYLSENDEFIFRGYGGEDRETGASSATMKEATFIMSNPYLESHAVVSMNNVAPDGGRVASCAPNADECYFRPKSLIDMVGVDTGLGYPSTFYGDSGGAVTQDDYYFGSLFGSLNDPIDGRYVSLFSDVTYLMEWFQIVVGEVVFPSDIGITIAEGDNLAHELKVPVQNFTDKSIPVGVASVESEDFEVLSDCSGTLEPSEGCMITVLFNAGYNSVTSEVSTHIDLGIEGASSQPLTVRFQAEEVIEVPDYPSCDEDPFYPGCEPEFDICEFDPYAEGCPPVECSVDPYQESCADNCDVWPDNCDPEQAPSEPVDNGGSGSSGGSTSFGVLALGLLLAYRRRFSIR